MIASTSSPRRPPSRVWNLKPLIFGGRWLAVIITAPSAPGPSSSVVENTAGVVERPQSSTSLSAAVKPSIIAAFSRGPEARGSWPTAMVRRSGVVPRRAASQTAKA